MYALGIPSARAASLVISDAKIKKDQIHAGDFRDEKCAVVLKAAPTFMRFGSFEVLN